jgi:hypothetical protein
MPWAGGVIVICLTISPQTRAYLANKCQTPFFIPQHKNTK